MCIQHEKTSKSDRREDEINPEKEKECADDINIVAVHIYM